MRGKPSRLGPPADRPAVATSTATSPGGSRSIGGSDDTGTASAWCWPVDVTAYDRPPTLTPEARAALQQLVTTHVGRGAGAWPTPLARALAPLVTPIRAAAAALHVDPHKRIKVTRLLLVETWRRDVPLWAWTPDDWVATIGERMPAFVARHGHATAHGADRFDHLKAAVRTLRQPVLGVAYLLTGFAEFARFPGHSLEPTSLAHTVFGRARMHAALDRLLAVLATWGYAPSVAGRLHTALAYVLLRARSPHLEALRREDLAAWYAAAHGAAHTGPRAPDGRRRDASYALAHLHLLSRVLAHLGLIAAPLERFRADPPLVARLGARLRARPATAPRGEGAEACSSPRASADVEDVDHAAARPVRRPRAGWPDGALTADVAPEWLGWVLAWHARALGAPRSRRHGLYTLLQVGRWLARTHPEVTSPAQWTYDLAADLVSAIDQLTVGAWRPAGVRHIGGTPAGTPLRPRTKAGLLGDVRRFFLDLQEVPHRPVGAAEDVAAEALPRRFDPRRALRTPRAIRALIGPDPRVIDERWWLKLLHAAETLTADDLGPMRTPQYPVALVQAVAVTWVLGGLRADELRRLRVGCVRVDALDVLGADESPDLASDRTADRASAHAADPAGGRATGAGVCLLAVPTHKTGAPFTKPVHALVGQRIAAWERERPPQARWLDPKTNERVDLLFAVRHQPLGVAYLNRALIPLLCRVAGVPPLDARGRITAHRARATLASALYNAPDGLTLDELGTWLGHKDLRSTRHYARLHPTRLVRSVARANQQARLVPVLLDPGAAGRGEPALFYALGEGAYCANPAWAACAHRLACLKCPMYVPRDAGVRLEARAGVQRLLQEVPLTEEERAVAEGDLVALSKYVAARRDVAPPPVPGPAYVFNPEDRTGDAAGGERRSG